MIHVPRIAIGTVQRGVDPSPLSALFLQALTHLQGRVQLFSDRFLFPPRDLGKHLCGQVTRFLDSQLMTQDICRENFLHGCRDVDYAVLYGRYRSACQPEEACLDRLCQWLEIPQIVIYDVTRHQHCFLQPLPEAACSAILCGVPAGQETRYQVFFETHYQIPVLGCLPATEDASLNVAALPENKTGWCRLESTIKRLAPTLNIDRMLDDFSRTAIPPSKLHRFELGQTLSGLRVAVAFDDAFDGYFPDVLDLLEAQGAEIHDFSPLGDQSLPENIDVVYFGDGHPEQYLDRLASNYCMKAALRNHLCRGRRLYAEGGGLAYLCHELHLPDRKPQAMAGLFPLIARYDPQPDPCVPQRVSLAHDHWLGAQGTRLSGYLHANWQFAPDPQDSEGPCGCVQMDDMTNDGYLFSHHRGVGSRLLINFASQEDIFSHLFNSQTIKIS